MEKKLDRTIEELAAHMGTSCVEGETQSGVKFIIGSDSESIRDRERLKIWKGIQLMIKSGDLGGSGHDGNAQRNGIILAANFVFDLGF